MNTRDIFKKAGGMKTIRQMAQSGSLGTAVGEFLLLGRSRPALELLRLSTRLKNRQKLEKRYLPELENYYRSYDTGLPHVSSDKVWICWFQGMENAPELVQRCYRSVKENLKDRDVVVITSENLSEYVQFPDYILDKWKRGIITHTHMTDLLRLELLIRYGGLWLDATVFCSSPEAEIPAHYFEDDLFFYQCLKPGRDGHCCYLSSWLLSAKTNDRVLMTVRHLCYEYWKKNDKMIDYFLLHIFFSMVLDHDPEAWKRVTPRDNAAPHILLLRLFDPYDERMWEHIRSLTPFHKLTYKFAAEDAAKKGTYYDVLFGGNH